MVYSIKDEERFREEKHSTQRTAFARDRARLIHSSAWRRLAAKTQVLSPTAGIDFARNRLTHSLEVGQIGTEIAESLGLDRNIVEAASLAHDIGHPPFGHNGERALDEWIKDFGGFEGNAQTLRILTRLEPKRFSETGDSIGLNLTRAVLDASCKYPWSRQEALTKFEKPPKNSPKFGYFEDDKHIYDWFRKGSTPGKQSAESQVMDLSDDIAYSVHDFEDAIVGGFIDPYILNSASGHDVLISKISDWAKNSYSDEQLFRAFDRLTKMPSWLRSWQGSVREQAKLKNFTSDMIGRFAKAATEATLQNAKDKTIARYGAPVIVPAHVLEEIAVLKGIVAAFVMASGERQPTYKKERVILIDLLQKLWETKDQHLDPQFAEIFLKSESEAEARRAIVDQVASLTDQAAINWHQKICV